ncbi:magnesium transporter [Loigolactobacillus backii]|uniref:magnesium transporter n=1 Tax=Loigolactobacillus backii TaxID=375175 RepID=UPI0007F14FF4|nr:magnesium transporter [Loigolactobacillus backii]ANK60067.1 magnesium transporter [Loigolactobacillus backii]ANK64950.1 magnesium transporter [Loigolactobacillus backii]ANK66549.1 magnesium transporter [Loigolactobacillus backii]OLF70774.1 magnesium transporter MgtE [Loigolactobacillus backii]PIO87260.1 magnesium transporter [Loigolactobacillus backii]
MPVAQETEVWQKQTNELKKFLAIGDAKAFRSTFLELHNWKQAQFFLSLDQTERLALYNTLTTKEVGDLFDDIDDDQVQIPDFLSEMEPSYAAEMLTEMYTDNAVDILEHLDKATVQRLLARMPHKTAAEMRTLLHYGDETAGAIMTTEYITIVAKQTVASAMAALRAEADEAELIYYVYVLDNDHHLAGIISLRDLIVNDQAAMINDIMNERVISVQVTDDQEAVAQTIRDYNFLAIPVTDPSNHLLGIITVDDVIDVIDDEAAADYSGLAGVDVEAKLESPLKSALKRLPWLITLLFLGMSTASLISHYENLVSEASVLAVFISLITGTAGNAGTQSLAVAVRRLAFKNEQTSLLRTLVVELITGLMIGVVTGLTITVVVGLWKHTFVLGFVIGLAMCCAIIVANLAGSFIPSLMERLGFDPAVASGPFISTLSDLTSVLIYFSIAQYFMPFFINK